MPRHRVFGTPRAAPQRVSARRSTLNAVYRLTGLPVARGAARGSPCPRDIVDAPRTANRPARDRKRRSQGQWNVADVVAAEARASTRLRFRGVDGLRVGSRRPGFTPASWTRLACLGHRWTCRWKSCRSWASPGSSRRFAGLQQRHAARPEPAEQPAAVQVLQKGHVQPGLQLPVQPRPHAAQEAEAAPLARRRARRRDERRRRPPGSVRAAVPAPLRLRVLRAAAAAAAAAPDAGAVGRRRPARRLSVAGRSSTLLLPPTRSNTVLSQQTARAGKRYIHPPHTLAKLIDTLAS